MGKWIRQRFVLMTGKLVSSDWRFIMELSENWPYKDEYIEADRRLEGLTYIKEKRAKETMENNPSGKGFVQLIEKT